jgi:hypothetical protein
MEELDWKTKGMNELLEDLRQRQRNVVFPDTVRNEGHFFRNLGSGNYDRSSPLRPIAAIFGVFLLLEYLYPALWFFRSGPGITILELLGLGLLGTAVSLKIVFNATFDRPSEHSPEFVRRRKKLSGRR